MWRKLRCATCGLVVDIPEGENIPAYHRKIGWKKYDKTRHGSYKRADGKMQKIDWRWAEHECPACQASLFQGERQNAE